MGDSRICSGGFPEVVVNSWRACTPEIFSLLPRPLFILIFALVMIYSKGSSKGQSSYMKINLQARLKVTMHTVRLCNTFSFTHNSSDLTVTSYILDRGQIMSRNRRKGGTVCN